jgi:hypothetical protein
VGIFLPPLVHLALLMRQHIALALIKLCAFLAVELPQPRQVLYRLRILELGEMLLVAQVGVDLVEVARVATRLLLGVLSSYGGHGRQVGGDLSAAVGYPCGIEDGRLQRKKFGWSPEIGTVRVSAGQKGLMRFSGWVLADASEPVLRRLQA